MANVLLSQSMTYEDAAALPLGNGENITIYSGSVITINADVRWGRNRAVIGAVTVDTTTGGEFFIDGRSTWWLPYDGKTGGLLYPGYQCRISGLTSQASGSLIGIWGSGNGEPFSSGRIIPSSGYLKLLRKSGNFIDNEEIRVSGVTLGYVSGIRDYPGGKRGWLHTVFEEANAITVPRLGIFRASGDWYELGRFNGTTGQEFTYYVRDYCPAVWVETDLSSNTYEPWANVYWKRDTYETNYEMYKMFICSSQGIITFSDGVSRANPKSGARIKVPNLHVSNSNSTNWKLNPLSNTLTTRIDFATTNAGQVLMSKCNFNGQLGTSLGQASRVELHHVGTPTAITITECASKVVLDNVVVSVPVNITSTPLTLTSCFAGVDMDNCYLLYNLAANNTYVVNASYCKDVYMDNCTFQHLISGATTASRNGAYPNLCSNVYNTNCKYINCAVAASTVDNLNYTNTYIGEKGGRKRATGGYDNFRLLTTCNNVLIDGIYVISGAKLPYNTDLIDSIYTLNMDIRNVGSQSIPLNLQKQSTYFVNFGGNNYNIRLQRCYISGPITQLVAAVNSDNQILLENLFCRSNPALTGFDSLNTIIKGCQWSSGNKITNIDTAFTSVYGYQFYDYFEQISGGRIGILFNEKTESEWGYNPQSAPYTIYRGNPQFNSAGNLYFANLNDAIIYEWPHFVKGYTNFRPSSVVIGGSDTGNLRIKYDINTGSGYKGYWTKASGAELAAESITPNTGFKLKVLISSASESNTKYLNKLCFYLRTTDAAKYGNLYPLDVAELELTGLQEGSEIRAYVGLIPSSAIEIGGTESSEDTFSFNQSYGGQDGYIIIFAPSYQAWKYELTYSSEDVSIPVQQIFDRQFLNP